MIRISYIRFNLRIRIILSHYIYASTYMGILDESVKARTNGLGFWRSKKFIIAAVLIMLSGGVYVFWPEGKKFAGQSQSAPKEWTVKKDDIVISVEAEGKVVAEDGVELSFAVSGDNLEVKEVFVKEGDAVKKGDKIASVSTDDLQLSMNSAWASYQSALADFNETMSGATAEEIADSQDKITTAKMSLEQAQRSLENIKQSIADTIYNAQKAVVDAKKDLDDNQDEQSSEDVSGAYEELVETLKSTNISLDGILRASDEIVGVDKTYLNDDFEINLGAKDLSSLSLALETYKKARAGAQDLNRRVIGMSKFSDFGDIESAADLASDVLFDFEEHLNAMKAMLDATITTGDLTESELVAFITSVNSNRSSINTKISALNAEVRAVADAKESLDDYAENYNEAVRDLGNAQADAERTLADAEASVASKELSLRQAERDLEELKAPLTEAELASARSRMSSASISLEKARNSLNDATIISPIDGQVVELNYKAGDIIVDNEDPVAVILNSSTLFITVNAEEADVSKLAVGQKAIATFPALDDLELKGEISFISLTSNTSNNGIVTYEVRVLIENTDEQKIREGMTASIEFVSSEVRDVLIIPVSAVRNVEGKPSVQALDGIWLPVVTGFTDGKYVEVISGLETGKKILY